jgi:hypothetical protein
MDGRSGGWYGPVTERAATEAGWVARAWQPISKPRLAPSADAVKPVLLDQLRQSHSADAKVDIFLREQLTTPIAAAGDSYGYGCWSG